MEAEEPPYAVQLHQSDAIELVKSGSILLILNVPPGTTFGFNTQGLGSVPGALLYHDKNFQRVHLESKADVVMLVSVYSAEEQKMFVVGPNFKGVKMVLPGPHFVYYSSKSRHGGDFSPVTGFFVHASPSQVIVRQWDTQDERLVKLNDSSEEERYELAARGMQFDRQLAPYNLDHHKTWQLLTNFISPNVFLIEGADKGSLVASSKPINIAFGEAEPVGGDISVMAEAALVQHTAKTPAERRMYEHIAKGKEQLLQKISSMSVKGNDIERNIVNVLEESNSVDLQVDKKSNGRCFYTHVPHFVKRTGMTASELTALNMDKTQILELLLEKEFEGEEDLLLGELQFSFIAFLMGQSLESFGQWKGIVSLLLRCEDAPLRTRTRLYTKFLRVIYCQLKQSLQPNTKSHNDPTDTVPLLEDGWLSEDNFFRLLLKDFFDMLRDASPIDGELLRQVVDRLFNMLRDASLIDGELLWQAKRLKKLVEETMGWIFGIDNLVGEEDDEYAPVVVYEEGMTMGDATEMNL